mmetsp:Transcript_32792/g.78326  ORF Transcript_32792/g.78326 Transcript_32792/m.78326 type:complete len:262 (+) Transcript_32792:717-1502(+)
MLHLVRQRGIRRRRLVGARWDGAAEGELRRNVHRRREGAEAVAKIRGARGVQAYVPRREQAVAAPDEGHQRAGLAFDGGRRRGSVLRGGFEAPRAAVPRRSVFVCVVEGRREHNNQGDRGEGPKRREKARAEGGGAGDVVLGPPDQGHDGGTLRADIEATVHAPDEGCRLPNGQEDVPIGGQLTAHDAHTRERGQVCGVRHRRVGTGGRLSGLRQTANPRFGVDAWSKYLCQANEEGGREIERNSEGDAPLDDTEGCDSED